MRELLVEPFFKGEGRGGGFAELLGVLLPATVRSFPRVPFLVVDSGARLQGCEPTPRTPTGGTFPPLLNLKGAEERGQGDEG